LKDERLTLSVDRKNANAATNKKWAFIAFLGVLRALAVGSL
jgi:hypothetical protein